MFWVTLEILGGVSFRGRHGWCPSGITAVAHCMHASEGSSICVVLEGMVTGTRVYKKSDSRAQV